MTSKLTRKRLEEIRDYDTCVTLDESAELARMALSAMDSEPVRNPVLAYADSYRDMAKQGVESVPIWSVITDLERNIAQLYIHAQQPVVPEEMTAGIAVKHWQGGRGSIESFVAGCNFFRAAMLNGGKS